MTVMTRTPASTNELTRACGQLLVVGFQGTELPDDVRRPLELGQRGGVILFRRNLPSIESAAALCGDALGTAVSSEPPPIVCVDQEGGRVRRLPSPPFVHLPVMRRLAGADDEELTRRAAHLNGIQLRAVGFNLNFAPVVDVDTNPDNPVIGDRAFAAEPGRVVAHAAAFIAGQRDAGIASCIKHFPGHGDTEIDSHLALPFVRHARDRLDAVELAPFARLAPLTDAVMSAHVVFEALDPRDVATRSRLVCTDLLRGELGFSGALFSDDMEMRAIADRASIEDNAVAAVEAGCDLLLICHSTELQHRAHAALVRQAEASADFRHRCAEAHRRALALRQRLPPSAAPLDVNAMHRQSEELEREIEAAVTAAERA